MAVNLSIAHAIGANPAQITKFFNKYKKWLDTWGLNTPQIEYGMSTSAV